MVVFCVCGRNACYVIPYFQMKETEQGTLEVVQAIQQTTVALHKVVLIYFW